MINKENNIMRNKQMSDEEFIRDIRRFEDMMNEIFENFGGPMPSMRRLLPLLPGGQAIEKYRESATRRPFIDVVETDKEVIATADMPGLDKGDIKINLTDDRLEISAEIKKEEEKKEKGYIYKERRSGSFYRAISLPSSVDPNNVKAAYNNGVLEIKMPKTEIKKKIPVTVE